MHITKRLFLAAAMAAGFVGSAQAADLDLNGVGTNVTDVAELSAYDGVTNSSETQATLTFNLADGEVHSFGVLSDLHLLDPALGLPKCEARSALFRTALARFRDRGVDGVLVCGDLTSNGFVTELEEVARVWFEVFPEGCLPDGRRVANLLLYGDHDMEGRIRKGESVRRLYAERELPLPPGLDEGDNRSAVCERLFHEPWAPLRRVTVKDHDFLLRSFTPEYMGRSPGLAESVAAVRADHPERPGNGYSTECAYNVSAESWLENDTEYTAFILEETGNGNGDTPFRELYGYDGAAMYRERKPNMRVVNCSSYVSLREKRSASSGRIAKVPLGAQVLAFPEAGDENGFILCVYHDKYGYILSEYLEKIE